MEVRKQWDGIFKVLKEMTTSQEFHTQETFPSGDNNTNPYKEIKRTGKVFLIKNYKKNSQSIFFILTIFLLFDLEDYIKQ